MISEEDVKEEKIMFDKINELFKSSIDNFNNMIK